MKTIKVATQPVQGSIQSCFVIRYTLVARLKKKEMFQVIVYGSGNKRLHKTDVVLIYINKDNDIFHLDETINLAL